MNVVLKGVRKLPITTLVQAKFYQTITYSAAYRVEIETALEFGKCFTRYAVKKLTHWEQRVTKYSVSIFDHRTELCDVTTSTNPITLKGGTTYRIKLSERTCTCNKW